MKNANKSVAGREAFVGTLSGVRILIDAKKGDILFRAEPGGKPITILAELQGIKLVPRAKALKEAKLAYERAWAKEHKREKPVDPKKAKKATPAKAKTTKKVVLKKKATPVVAQAEAEAVTA